MKRRLAAGLAALAIMVMALAGCQEAQVQLDAAQAADAILSAVSFEDEMTAVDADMRDTLYGTSASDIANAKVYVSTGATAEEIAVFEAVDEAAAGRIAEAVDKRLEQQRLDYEDYAPAEMPKLNDPALVKEGKYILLCVSNDKAAAMQKINELLGK